MKTWDLERCRPLNKGDCTLINGRYIFYFIFLNLGMLVRLRGSPSPNMGRVEVYYAGKWGSIYFSGWDIKDATVVCRQLGFTKALLAGEKLFCSITLPIFFQNFGCYGNESAIDQCAWEFVLYTWSSSYCANVMCSNGGADLGKYQFCTHLAEIMINIKGIENCMETSCFYLVFDDVVTPQMNRDVSNTCCWSTAGDRVY